MGQRNDTRTGHILNIAAIDGQLNASSLDSGGGGRSTANWVIRLVALTLRLHKLVTPDSRVLFTVRLALVQIVRLYGLKRAVHRQACRRY